MFRESKAEPECILCKGTKGTDCWNVAGSSRSLAFRRTLDEVKK